MRKLLTFFKKKFYNLMLREKLISLLIITGIVPTLFIALFSYTNTRTKLIDQAYINVSKSNTQINNSIEEQMQTYFQICSMLYTNSDLKYYLTKQYTSDIDFVIAYNYINNLSYSLLITNSNIESITFYINNQTLPSDGLFVKHIEYFEDDLGWLKAKETFYGNIALRNTQYSQKKGYCFALGRTMNYKSSNAAYGYLVIEIHEDLLGNLIEKDSNYEHIYIVNEENDILSAHNKSLISKNVNQYLGEKVISNESITQKSVKINDEKFIVVCNIMKNGWKTVSVVSLQSILGEITRSISHILIVCIICILLSCILIWIITHYFSSRFDLLNKQISMIENNNFNFNIHVAENDEMGRLAKAFNKMASQLDKAINDVYVKELQRKEAEVYLLQSQINPHFLYNTLSGIGVLALRNNDTVVNKYINHLAQFYKISLNKGKNIISMKEEIEITKHYIHIQEMRFDNMFLFTWQVDEQLLSCAIIKLILQPFIENIVNHAVKNDLQPVNTIISIYKENSNIYLEIQDDGIGISEQRLMDILDPTKQVGYGLKNVNARIKLSYGDEFGITVTSVPLLGTKALVIIPYISNTLS